MQPQDPNAEISAPKAHKRKWLALALVLAVVGVRSGYLAWQVFQPQPLKPLADFVMAQGRVRPIILPLAQQLGIPLANLTCHHQTAKSQSGQVRLLQVRERPGNNYRDIILSNIAPGETEAYYYLTSPDGKLLKSLHLKDTVQPVENAEELFRKELDFWQHWQFAKTKSIQPQLVNQVVCPLVVTSCDHSRPGQ